jgi:uncharacterized protein YkwD
MRDRRAGAAARILAAAGVLAALVCACAGRPAERSPDPALRPIEIEILRLTNDWRRKRSLPPLREAAPLADLARGHSGEMARGGGDIGHDGFRSRFRAAAASLPLMRFAENVARTGTRPKQPASWVVSRWLESPTHRDHIEGPFALTGIGVVRSENGALYFTQLFAEPAPR